MMDNINGKKETEVTPMAGQSTENYIACRACEFLEISTLLY